MTGHLGESIFSTLWKMSIMSVLFEIWAIDSVFVKNSLMFSPYIFHGKQSSVSSFKDKTSRRVKPLTKVFVCISKRRSRLEKPKFLNDIYLFSVKNNCHNLTRFPMLSWSVFIKWMYVDKSSFTVCSATEIYFCQQCVVHLGHAYISLLKFLSGLFLLIIPPQ